MADEATPDAACGDRMAIGVTCVVRWGLRSFANSSARVVILDEGGATELLEVLRRRLRR